MDDRHVNPPGAASPATTGSLHPPAGGLGFREFVTIVSGLMGLTALSIDTMLPALGNIAHDYGIDPTSNRQQLIITVYLLGFAAGQPFYGPMSDRFGRKPMLLFGLGVYLLASIACIVTDSFEVLLAARFIQGLGTASPRIIALATIRDLYGGRRMAEVMSFVMMVFIIVPILAPSIGGVILLIGEWHLVFGLFALFSSLLLVWTALRLPETHPAEKREPMSARWLLDAFKQTLTTRQTIGYTLAMGLILGTLMAYVTTAEQIFVDVFHTGKWFPVLFGVVAAMLAIASFVNSRLVLRLGMHRISHTALLGFVITSTIHLAYIHLVGPPPLGLFLVLISTSLLFFGLVMPNFNALAMEPMGRIAGTASSFVGGVTTGISAVLSGLLAQTFNGTVTPFVTGMVLFGAAGLVLVLWTERGHLFRPTHDSDPEE